MTKAMCKYCFEVVEVEENREVKYCCNGLGCYCDGYNLLVERCDNCLQELNRKIVEHLAEKNI